ncbi:MAG: polyphosphate kinase 1 [Opitutales bacterium]
MDAIPPPERFDRELSWLNFNGRVLSLSREASVPLLERVRFLSIVSSNLDEFFEIRVAGLMQQVESAPSERAERQLAEVLARAHAMVDEQYRIWREELAPALASEGIVYRERGQLSKAEQSELAERFEQEILPALTPLAVDPAHPFPVLTNKNLYVLVQLRDDDGSPPTVAVVPVPRILPRVLLVGKPGDKVRFTFLSHIIKAFLHRLFPDLQVLGAWAFRITRNSDLYVEEDDEGNLIQAIEKEIHNLRKGAPVRLEISGDAPDELVDWLLRSLELPEANVFRIDGPINLLRLGGLLDLLQRPELAYPALAPALPEAVADPAKLYRRIAKADILLHHPYESFTPVVDFLRQAAADPDVVSIKLTLYRTSGDSPVVEALKEAARNGKQVTALVELRARFDELNNIAWARQLEEAGAHVVYGLFNYKTHCKACLVVRREKGVLRRYAHLGTGNYNPRTAKVYTDLSLFTADPELTEEVGLLFNVLTGNLRKPRFLHLLVAPFELQARMISLINAEAEAARKGRPSGIFAKVNSLVDPLVIDALYRASRAGVPIELVVRGICCLVPGVPGQSETIRVRSVLGRFLEHSRVFRFAHGGRPLLYLGSADWMQRNFLRRVECVFPVRDPAIVRRVEQEILPPYLSDAGDVTFLQPDGTHRPANAAGRATPGIQDTFLTLAAKSGVTAKTKTASRRR